jgi:hypothetical protein
MGKAHILMVGGPSVGQMTWIPPVDDLLRARIVAGEPTDADFQKIPNDQVLSIGHLVSGRVPDVIGMSTGPFVLSPALKAFLETNEPDVHRFLPIQIHTRELFEGKPEHGKHWMLVPPPIVDCLNIEKTVMTYDIQNKKWDRKKDESNLWGGGVPFGDDLPCFFDRLPVEGRHLWRILEGSRSRAYACSAEFWKFFRSQKMIGWINNKTCNVD